ncbi:MAG TPA: lytic transglycosylase domain-containing protein [Stellaceae bacterium]
MSRLLPLAILAGLGAPQFARADGVLDRIADGVDGAESSHGSDPGMWRSEPDGPQGPMQVSAAAATDVGGGDRFDETQNRALGRAYLAHMYRRYGGWPDAIAAYNWGPGHLDEWISGGRPVDKFPIAVQRYRNRVLVGSGLAAAEGADSLYQWANLRLARLERLRVLAKHEMAERRRNGRRSDPVQRLYAELMRSTSPGAP